MNQEAFLEGFEEGLTKAADMDQALIHGLIVAALLGGGYSLSHSPSDKKKVKPEAVSVPMAGLTGVLAPAGTVIHGALVDRRNRTGMMNNINSPSAMSRLTLPSTFGAMGGALAGLGANNLFGSPGQMGPSAVAGALGGGALGGMWGANSYNKKMKL